ncbi:MAG: CDP-diacylglycerol--glycerol-3-phosphate 3-phosphatidyltransferase [Ignavibacteria bacterium GWA2_55_11]|nr:MAG: CDP-diacylglycerol--glycerol-3-phosphate 3-phosphatidyltransferase [Ignavibacteria bacterium GWA2_55_11]OGU43391.1 MAG: CDP-diacylglycerol--glycerol-3-phosphate 3-phosphatidyltransferase [Ignavibacteria bacterium GWC2_56_12]OGU62565.1 MAG: CDP-diacylglycerol--glycerol-3-phosphate 3-phosphatidyltransferase [Ignavibacteria bacterium RIFCSPHIGHO2_02_FULL_56_12]OGU69787.1 MAG: CDP-diacylglycerol--glycerol-3-phosphate 3-phosphatidyltransferase [Ignavibacteria bacterium RIFCSPLOWO2_02_FULL_55_
MLRFFSPPNQLTFLRILLTPVFVGMYLSQDPTIRQLSLAVFVIAMLTDWYDGWVARRWGFVTRWGTFFDPFADKVFISSTLFAFVAVGLVPGWTVWAIVGRDVVITFLRSYSELKGRPFDTSRLAKSKTFFQFLAICYILVLDVARTMTSLENSWRDTVNSLLSRTIIDPLMIFAATFTLITGIAYIITNRTTLRKLYGLPD